jgi:hypothetical protein
VPVAIIGTMTDRPTGCIVLILVLLVGCTGNPPGGSQPASAPLEATDDATTPSPALSPAPTPATSAIPSASSPEPSAPTATASADQAALVVGEMVETNIGGLRARTQPGTSSPVVHTLPEGAIGLVELGPLSADGYDWYRVQYAYLNAFGVTDGGRGWMASGSSDAPWLVPTERHWDHGPIAGFAGSGSELIGAVQMNDPWQEIRWAALGSDCSFVLTFESESQRAAGVVIVVDGYAEGVVEDLFPDTPEFVGSVAVRIATECRWTYAIVTYIG